MKHILMTLYLIFFAAYLLDYENNVITVDWAPFAGTDIDSTDQYILSIAFMNDLVAPFVVKYVEFMTGSLATPTANIHLIGHSLGAHLMAIVAKKTKVYWVTGEFSSHRESKPFKNC